MKPWVPFPAPHKLGVLVQTCHSSTWKVEARGSEVQDYPYLHRESESSLGYIRPYWGQESDPMFAGTHLVPILRKPNRWLSVSSNQVCST